MDRKHSLRRDVIQWALAVVMVLTGIAVWHLSPTHQAHADESQPDDGSGCETQ
jgi:hypothetical protein